VLSGSGVGRKNKEASGQRSTWELRGKTDMVSERPQELRGREE